MAPNLTTQIWCEDSWEQQKALGEGSPLRDACEQSL